MNVLIACEFSGIVRDAFRTKGYNAVSCDLLPSEREGPHIQDDILNHLEGWDMMIAFPPCTYLAVSGARWFASRHIEQQKAIQFVRALMFNSVPKICIENPIGILSTVIRKPDQIIQPWMFGHAETKATCLWLKNLPHLVPTSNFPPLRHRVHMEPPSSDRWKNRSRMLPGIANAMANQWG